MSLKKKILLIPIVIYSLSGCLGLPQNSSSDELTSETAAEDSVPESGSATDEFAEFENPSETSAAETTTTDSPSQESQSNATAASDDEFAQFEQQEANGTSIPQQTENSAEQQAPVGSDELSLEQNQPPAEQVATVEEPTTESSPPVQVPPSEPSVPAANVAANEPSVDDLDPFVTTEPPKNVPVKAPELPTVKIKAIQYKANVSGGAILIQADGPVQFMTRNNPDTQQLVVEIPGALLPDRLKRPFNLRDIKGAFGSLDSYQAKGSSVARFVVQLRPNASDPFVTAEGNTIIIAADKAQLAAIQSLPSVDSKAAQSGQALDSRGERVLTSRTLQEFLVGNNQFYGKKISLEVNSMPVRDALRFLADEGGINMIIANNIEGNVSLKLRDVPWDQAFVIIMKSRDLGYVRQGDVLRIARLEDLRKEEEAAIKFAESRLQTEPLVVKVFSINYAVTKELADRLKDFLSQRGKVAADERSNSLIVTDIQQSIDRVSQLIKNLDVQPPQVLIEGRIIEATDTFLRQVGIRWALGGGQATIGNSGGNPVTLRPTLGINPNVQAKTEGGGTLSLEIGTLDLFGVISATLQLGETDRTVRILSSPRIVTLSNSPAKINQTVSIPVTTIPQAQQGVINPIPQVQFQELKLGLEVTPQVTADASVIMQVKVNRDIRGDDVGGQPSFEKREADTRIIVKNGQTSVIGGVYQNDKEAKNDGVPWLKDIPVLGSLFKFSENRGRKTELIIFLTPRIVAVGSDNDSPATN